MKFVKGVTIFLVLCFAAFGAFALLKPPPKLSVSESEKDYLQTLGIDVQGGAASESGLSGLFDDIQDDAPAGAATGSFASSAPPSFLAGSTASSVAPSFGESAPLVSAEVPALQSAPVFPAPVLPVPATEVLPPQNFAEPIRAPIQAPLQEAPAFDTAPPFAAPPSVQVQESPPPWKGNWDGPASTLPATPPSSNPLPPLNISPIPTVALPHSVNRQPLTGGENVHRIETESAKPVNTFSPMESVPQETAPPQYTPQYTPTSARQPLTFEPVKPGQSANSPRVAFSSPKRSDSAPQPAFNQVENFPLRSIDRPTGPPSADLSPLRETFEQHMQPLQQLVDSGDPQKIRTAFIQLSQLYEHNQLNESERAMMLPLLDRLALQVIYSRDTHILEPP
ncbi:MAG: hypothetical protein LBI05_11920 [Planctomycetaceae bacterium]|nr:hypothetical protein [Planctomycetaceae bacterium]